MRGTRMAVFGFWLVCLVAPGNLVAISRAVGIESVYPIYG